MEQNGSRVPYIQLAKCQDKHLAPGQKCMDEDELRSYFSGNVSLRILYSNTFIDYDDIDDPLKSLLIGSQAMTIEVDREIRSRVILMKHEFWDMTDLFQLFSDPEETEFLNVLDI